MDGTWTQVLANNPAIAKPLYCPHCNVFLFQNLESELEDEKALHVKTQEALDRVLLAKDEQGADLKQANAKLQKEIERLNTQISSSTSVRRSDRFKVDKIFAFMTYLQNTANLRHFFRRMPALMMNCIVVVNLVDNDWPKGSIFLKNVTLERKLTELKKNSINRCTLYNKVDPSQNIRKWINSILLVLVFFFVNVIYLLSISFYQTGA